MAYSFENRCILLIDACREDDDRSGEGIGLENHQGVIRLFSCAPNQISYEIEELQQGAFTYALLQGLRIQGEGNCATVGRLAEHIRVQVPYLVEKYKGARQTPILGLEPESKKDLIILPRQATPDDVKNLKLAALEMESEGELDIAEGLWIRVLAASPADMQAVKAIQRIERNRLKLDSRSEEGRSDAGQGRRAVVIPSVVQPAKPVEEEKPKLPSYSFRIITLDAKGKKIDEQQGSKEYFAEDLGNGVTLDMVNISGGEFQMGVTDKEVEEAVKNAVSYGHSEANARTWANWGTPRHRVRVPDFSMGKFLVTQAQWKQVAAMKKVKIDLKINPEEFTRFQGKDLPVDSVNWHQAVEFCQRLSKHTGNKYRLPSEAEWEYACRAGTESAFHFGATITPEYVNYDGNYPYAQAAKGEYRQKTTPIGKFPNGFGLYDMHGNLWEWCEDDWHENYQGAPDNGKAWIDNDNHSQDKTLIKVLRGGSWSNFARFCRSGNRVGNDAEYDHYCCGFRVACLPFLPRTH